MTFLSSHTPTGKVFANLQQLMAGAGPRKWEVCVPAQGPVIFKPSHWFHRVSSPGTQLLLSHAAQFAAVGPTSSLCTAQEALQVLLLPRHRRSLDGHAHAVR